MWNDNWNLLLKAENATVVAMMAKNWKGIVTKKLNDGYYTAIGSFSYKKKGYSVQY